MADSQRGRSPRSASGRGPAGKTLNFSGIYASARASLRPPLNRKCGRTRAMRVGCSKSLTSAYGARRSLRARLPRLYAYPRCLAGPALVRATRHGRHSTRTGHASPASLRRQCRCETVIRRRVGPRFIDKLALSGFCQESAAGYPPAGVHGLGARAARWPQPTGRGKSGKPRTTRRRRRATSARAPRA